MATVSPELSLFIVAEQRCWVWGLRGPWWAPLGASLVAGAVWGESGMVALLGGEKAELTSFLRKIEEAERRLEELEKGIEASAASLLEKADQYANQLKAEAEKIAREAGEEAEKRVEERIKKLDEEYRRRLEEERARIERLAEQNRGRALEAALKMLAGAIQP